MEQSRIRNFCIIAHIDHGKSTLADRLLEFTGTVEKRKMREQLLDQMELERERGITIKLAPARMNYHPSLSLPAGRQAPLTLRGGEQEYVLNLIDTPGHVDFTYEVSRSLAAVEGCLLLVDATQGVQAQTLGNLHLAQELGLAIIPVINKIDLPNVQIEKTVAELAELLNVPPKEIILASGKTGAGVPEILQAIVTRLPSPKGEPAGPPRALIFDSKYDEYKGVIAFVRVVDGVFRRGARLRLAATAVEGELLELGFFKPEMTAAEELGAGEIGYLVTGFKEIEQVRVGDTVELAGPTPVEALPGYREVRPMVFAGIFPREGSDFERLRAAMAKLKLNDAALIFEPSRSSALGFGFQVGSLGLLHLEIIQERLRREFGLELVVTVPTVAYRVTTTDGGEQVIKSPVELPDASRLARVEEPWVKVD
ncbi:elongation factor 4, partial [Patescibacteria group bacterium]